MENKLKPCPFCGGKAKFVTISNNSNHLTVGFDFGIECKKCGVGTPKHYSLSLELGESGTIVPLHDERNIAVNEWNQRGQGTKKKKQESCRNSKQVVEGRTF